MNNFHIRIEDCTDAQKARLAQVYGSNISYSRFVGFDSFGHFCFWGQSPDNELITPDEFFKRLGLDVDAKQLRAQNKALKQCVSEEESENARLKEVIAGLRDQVEHFERESLNRGNDLSMSRQANKDLCQRVKKLEQQLAKQPLDVDWGLVCKSINFVNQCRETGDVFFHKCGEFNPDHWITLATRPKPKYTEEQIQAVRDAVMNYQKHVASTVLMNFEELEVIHAENWLKEQGYE